MTRPAPIRRILATILMVSHLIVLAGCGAGWRNVETPWPSGFAERQQVQVWHQGNVEQWHAVVVSADRVSGVPFIRPPDCDSCRVSLPSAVVDSLRTGNPTAGFWKSVGLVVGGLFLVCALRCPRETS